MLEEVGNIPPAEDELPYPSIENEWGRATRGAIVLLISTGLLAAIVSLLSKH